MHRFPVPSLWCPKRYRKAVPKKSRYADLRINEPIVIADRYEEILAIVCENLRQCLYTGNLLQNVILGNDSRNRPIERKKVNVRVKHGLSYLAMLERRDLAVGCQQKFSASVIVTKEFLEVVSITRTDAGDVRLRNDEEMTFSKWMNITHDAKTIRLQKRMGKSLAMTAAMETSPIVHVDQCNIGQR